MKKHILKICTVLAFCFLAGVFSGCQKAQQKMKMPSMKFITRDSVHGVIAPDDSHIWLVGAYGSIHHSNDGGKTWKQQESGLNRQTTGVDNVILSDGVFLDTSTGWVAGTNGTMLHTTDGGTIWTRQETGTKRHIFSVTFVDKQTGWACGDGATMLHTTDGGTTWKQQIEDMDVIFNNVYFVDRQYGWMVGEFGLVYATTDGGATWDSKVPACIEPVVTEEEFTTMVPTLYGVQFTDRRNGWACGMYSTIIRTTDGGQTWQKVANDGENQLFTVLIKGSRGYAVGDKGAYLVSTDGGASFALQKEAIKTRMWFRDVTFSSPDKGWVVGSGGIVTGTSDGGRTFAFYSGLSYEFEGFQMPEELERRAME